MINDEVFKLAESAANRVSYHWPDAIDKDDLTQEILVRLMRTPNAIDRLFTEDEITRRSFMIKVAHQVASDMMVEYDIFSGNYIYDTELVRKLLENKAWIIHTDKLNAERMDLIEAIENLAKRNSPYYAEIFNRYQDDVKPTTGSGRKKLSRAVVAVMEEMNQIGMRRRRDYGEGPGIRKVVGNHTALDIARMQYGAEMNKNVTTL